MFENKHKIILNAEMNSDILSIWVGLFKARLALILG